jgi:hypothetical protein
MKLKKKLRKLRKPRKKIKKKKLRHHLDVDVVGTTQIKKKKLLPKRKVKNLLLKPKKLKIKTNLKRKKMMKLQNPLLNQLDVDVVVIGDLFYLWNFITICTCA